jgi:phosphotransferase system enzyme I (PtsI)
VPSSAPQVFSGLGGSPGLVVGRAYLVDRRKVRTPRTRIAEEEIEAELVRFSRAVALADQQLQDVKERISTGDAHDHALILEAHRLMLQDPMFVDEVRKLVARDRCNAEWAVRRVVRKIRHMFDNIQDEYFRERRNDLDFVADRVVRNLVGAAVDEEVEVPDGAIIVAHDLSPADTAVLLKSGRVMGFVTDLGGQTSHTAIVARARETPAVVGAGRASEWVQNGDLLALDGTTGVVLINPSESALAAFRETMQVRAAEEQALLKTKDLQATSLDGFRMVLKGNMEFLEEIPSLLAHGAEGIGLFRTEFMFLDRETPPNEEEQFEAYRAVLEAMGSRPVTIRTLDLGGDKVPGGVKKSEREHNPAMGLRAIRYCLQHRDIFRTQLRALLRASAYGSLRIMFPLVSGLSELREARSELEACRSELGREGVRMGGRIPVGVMVETPSAAWIADRLAQEADFFSVGTNDLIQYSIAIDRQNQDVAYLYKPLHLSVLRALKHICEAARAARIPVAMCGEMAGEPAYTLLLLAMGFDELSMTAGQIPSVKQFLRRVNRADAVALLEEAMKYSTAEEIERFVQGELERRFA